MNKSQIVEVFQQQQLLLTSLQKQILMIASAMPPPDTSPLEKEMDKALTALHLLRDRLNQFSSGG